MHEKMKKKGMEGKTGVCGTTAAHHYVGQEKTD
jgi:hypothetical protein